MAAFLLSQVEVGMVSNLEDGKHNISMKLTSVFLLHYNKRRFQNPVAHLTWSFSAEIVNRFLLLAIFAKNSIVDVRPGSKYIFDNHVKSVNQGKLGLQGDDFGFADICEYFFCSFLKVLSFYQFASSQQISDHKSKGVHKEFDLGNSELLTQKLTQRDAIP